MTSQQYVRYPVTDVKIKSSGPYEAVVVNHLDPYSMGALEVELLAINGSSGVPERSGQLVTVRYLSPFFGNTPFRGLTPNDGYQYTQKSYGFWMIPPDPGSRVLIIFAEGHSAYGYWIGCIPESGMNFMTPDPRASTTNTTEATPANLQGLKLPVGEYNKTVEQGSQLDPTLFPKPYNKDFTELLEVQGLLFDEVRGTTTSSARRETPSMVFGVSTPGPWDKREGRPTTKYGHYKEQIDVPFNRLGGSSFVMDDGDDKFVRATHASDGPPLYVNKEAGENGGDETIPQNECIRFRTRTGHQILLHNSEDLIYISNSRGTAWIELTSDGKIDIHADDSISVMTNQDFNFSAVRDVNIEAGRNINMKASAFWSDGQPTKNGIESGRVHIESEYNMNFVNGGSLGMNTSSNFDFNVEGQLNIRSTGDLSISSDANIYQEAKNSVHQIAGGNWFRKVASDIVDDASNLFTQIGNAINVTAGADIKEQAGGSKQTVAASDVRMSGGGQVSANAGGEMLLTSAGNQNIKGSNVLLTGGSIEQNGAEAQDAPIAESASTGVSGNTPISATVAASTGKLPTIALPFVIPGEKFPVRYDSITTRAPQHEPWTHHENMDPLSFKPEELDREVSVSEITPTDRVLTPDTFLKNKSGLKSSVFVEGSGGTIGDHASSGLSGFADPGANVEFIPGTVNLNGPIVARPPGGQGPLAEIVTSKKKLKTRVAAVFQSNFQGFIDDLEATGYVINSLGGYVNRNISGSGKASFHASGAAIDINPRQNPHEKPARNPVTTDLKPIETVRALAKKYGLGWGADWTTSSDAMHFCAAKRERGAYDVIAGIIPGPSGELPPAQKEELGNNAPDPNTTGPQ